MDDDKKTITDDNIIAFLREIERDHSSVNWNESFLEFSNTADECGKIIGEIAFLLQYRELEKSKKLKIIPMESVIELWRESLKNSKNNYPGDPFFFPGHFLDENENVIYYDNEEAAKYSMRMFGVEPGTLEVKPFEIPSNLADLHGCALALKKIFHVLAQIDNSKNNNPLPKVLPYLMQIFFLIENETKNRWKDIEKQEKQREQNRKNQKKSDQKEQRLKALKLHPKYPELFEAIKKYRHTGRGKDKSAINKLLNEMTGIKNQVTIRCYRNDLIEDFLNSEK